MANELQIWQNKQVVLPDYLDDFANEVGDNVKDKQTVPSLSYEGKTWTISVNGEKTKLTKTDADTGDEVPVPVFRVVVLGFNARRGRAYYEGSYDPDKPLQPLCWSQDGDKPDEHVQDPQCASCKTCPMAAKGSKITDNGKQTVACSPHRMLVVVPASDLSFQPLRLKLAITSDFDKQSPDLADQYWFGFQQFLDFIKAKGIRHTAQVVVKMKFDPNVAYPKVIFRPDRPLTKEELDQVRPLVNDPDVAALLDGTWTPAGVDGVKNEEPAALPAPKQAAKPAPAKPAPAKPVTTKPAAKPAPAPEPEEGEEEGEEAQVEEAEEEEEAELPAAKPAAKPAPKPTAKPAVVATKPTAKPAGLNALGKPRTTPKPAAVEAEEDEEAELPAAKPAPKAAAKPVAKGAAKPAPVESEVPDEVAALLDEWD